MLIHIKQEQEGGYTAQITPATSNIIPLKGPQVTLKELSNTAPSLSITLLTWDQ